MPKSQVNPILSIEKRIFPFVCACVYNNFNKFIKYIHFNISPPLS